MSLDEKDNRRSTASGAPPTAPAAATPKPKPQPRQTTTEKKAAEAAKETEAKENLAKLDRAFFVQAVSRLLSEGVTLSDADVFLFKHIGSHPGLVERLVPFARARVDADERGSSGRHKTLAEGLSGVVSARVAAVSKASSFPCAEMKKGLFEVANRSVAEYYLTVFRQAEYVHLRAFYAIRPPPRAAEKLAQNKSRARAARGMLAVKQREQELHAFLRERAKDGNVVWGRTEYDIHVCAPASGTVLLADVVGRMHPRTKAHLASRLSESKFLKASAAAASNNDTKDTKDTKDGSTDAKTTTTTQAVPELEAVLGPLMNVKVPLSFDVVRAVHGRENAWLLERVNVFSAAESGTSGPAAPRSTFVDLWLSAFPALLAHFGLNATGEHADEYNNLAVRLGKRIEELRQPGQTPDAFLLDAVPAALEEWIADADLEPLDGTVTPTATYLPRGRNKAHHHSAATLEAVGAIADIMTRARGYMIERTNQTLDDILAHAGDVYTATRDPATTPAASAALQSVLGEKMRAGASVCATMDDGDRAYWFTVEMLRPLVASMRAEVQGGLSIRDGNTPMADLMFLQAFSNQPHVLMAHYRILAPSNLVFAAPEVYLSLPTRASKVVDNMARDLSRRIVTAAMELRMCTERVLRMFCPMLAEPVMTYFPSSAATACGRPVVPKDNCTALRLPLAFLVVEYLYRTPTDMFISLDQCVQRANAGLMEKPECPLWTGLFPSLLSPAERSMVEVSMKWGTSEWKSCKDAYHSEIDARRKLSANDADAKNHEGETTEWDIIEDVVSKTFGSLSGVVRRKELQFAFEFFRLTELAGWYDAIYPGSRDVMLRRATDEEEEQAYRVAIANVLKKNPLEECAEAINEAKWLTHENARLLCNTVNSELEARLSLPNGGNRRIPGSKKTLSAHAQERACIRLTCRVLEVVGNRANLLEGMWNFCYPTHPVKFDATAVVKTFKATYNSNETQDEKNNNSATQTSAGAPAAAK